MILRLVKTRLAVRSVLIILMISGLVGLVFMLGGRALVTDHERRSFQLLLEDLLSTVEKTASIALFLGDEQLAREVASGLLQNNTVKGVSIRSSDKVLATMPVAMDVAGQDGVLQRAITSPFAAEEVIGEVVLVPNQEAIREVIETDAGYITLFFLGQLSTVAVSIVIVVILLITRPIAQISRRLHGLKVEVGEKLPVPRGNESDEIGTLVKDVNSMIDYLVRLLDVERQLRLEREVEERKFRAIVENAETGIFLVDDERRLLSANPAFCRFFAVNPRDIGEQRIVLTDMLADFAEPVSELIQRCLGQTAAESIDVHLAGRSGDVWLNMLFSRVATDRLQGIVNDITERKLAERAARQQAVTDALTGISNRLGFEQRLQWQVDSCRRFPERHFALMMLDLDLFKQVNDTYGHLAGDAVLVEVAHRLQKIVRKTDFVARLGGDEFAAIFEATGEREVLAKIAAEIVERIAEPIMVTEGVAVRVGASIGIAVHSGGELTLSSLLTAADEAMYDAKHGGRNAYRFYQPRG